MQLDKLSILNYKNIADAQLAFSPNVNCFVGANGMGKTNVLDAIYYLSFCKSASNLPDRENIRHGTEACLLNGSYTTDSGTSVSVSCGMKAGARKHLRRDGKDVRRLSAHVGTIPLVLIAPRDILLATGGSEERRRFMDSVIAQCDASYLEALIRYDKVLRQRNALLRQDEEPDPDVMDALEHIMDTAAAVITSHRQKFVEAFLPRFSALYAQLSDNAAEAPSIDYITHATRGPLKPQLEQARERERIVGYTLHGPHKDDLQLTLNGYAVKHEASQGQTKTYVTGMKLAQYYYLRDQGERRTPILLLDDIFAALDAGRMERIIRYAASDALGQIFITDTDRNHIRRILAATQRDYRLFSVSNGRIEETIAE